MKGENMDIKYAGTVTMDTADYIALIDLMRSYKHDVDFWKEAYMKKSEELKKMEEAEF